MGGVGICVEIRWFLRNFHILWGAFGLSPHEVSDTIEFGAIAPLFPLVLNVPGEMEPPTYFSSLSSLEALAKFAQGATNQSAKEEHRW